MEFSGGAAVGFTATLGPRLGMRTMVITRYSFGYWGAAVVSFLNILTQVCFRFPFAAGEYSTFLARLVLHSPLPTMLSTILNEARLLRNWDNSRRPSTP